MLFTIKMTSVKMIKYLQLQLKLSLNSILDKIFVDAFMF